MDSAIMSDRRVFLVDCRFKRIINTQVTLIVLIQFNKIKCCNIIYNCCILLNNIIFILLSLLLQIFIRS